MRKFAILFCLLFLVISTASCARKSSDDSNSTSNQDSSSSVGSGEGSGVISIGNDSDSQDDGSNGGSGSANILRVTTYNVGLLPAFVSQVDQRVAPIADRLANDVSDVICIQELWRDQDRNAIEQRLAAQYPFRMRTAARQKFADSAPACTISSFEPIAECLISRCAFTQDDIIACATNNCRDSIFTLAATEPLCAAALFAQSGRSSNEILDIQEELLSDSNPAGLFAFGGESGTEIFSKLPLNEQQVVDFFDDSTTSRRVALLATVEQNGVATRIGCTHLSSNLDGILPYTGAHGSWAGENQVQAMTLVTAANNSSSERVVLAGDFNCSQENPTTGAGGDFAASCQTIRAAGYSDPAADSLRCSYCNENILNQMKSGQGEQRDLVLDHLFIRGVNPISTASIFYDEIIQIDGNQSNLSDHYGVSLLLRTQ